MKKRSDYFYLGFLLISIDFTLTAYTICLLLYYHLFSSVDGIVFSPVYLFCLLDLSILFLWIRERKKGNHV